mmetsp:Transcript_41767/g.93565  ORF Transcript_41767/g.93565 Transcript_41767/m.93565 type:complete len:358 (-) Transcript_41767:54-1127(-)
MADTQDLTIRPQGPRSMSHLYFPPRGMPRPQLTQVLSEPDLRKEFFQHEETKDRQQYRQEWSDIMQHLDDQVLKRKKDHKRRIESEVALNRARDAHRRSEKAVSLQAEKPPWNYPEPMEYFEQPRPGLLMEASNTFHKNDLLMGIFDTPNDKPAHWEFDTFGGWAPFVSSSSLAKDAKEKPMDAKAKMYQERLERKLRKAKELERQDEAKKYGALKKKQLEENANEFSCLKREKPAWTEQRVYTHEIFSNPEPYQAGDFYYETGIGEHITQPDKSKDYARGVICGDGVRKSFWKEPPGGAVKGTAMRALRAKALLCPRGCAGLQEDLVRQVQVEEMRKSRSSPTLRGTGKSSTFGKK